MKKLLLLPLFALAFLVACNKDDDDMDDDMNCVTMDLTYNNDISMIFNESCALIGCHASGSINGSLATYTDALTFIVDHPILQAIRHEAGASPMPQGFPKLSDCKIDQIAAWIADGTPE